MEWLGRQRKYLIAVRTKPDEVVYTVDVRARKMDALRSALKDVQVNRIEVAPPRMDKALQRQMAAHAMETAWRQGGWTLDLDELLYLDRLGLLDEYEQLYTQGRSLKLTLLAGMQRPVQISRFTLSQSRHVISFGMEGRDVNMTLAPATSPRMKDVVPSLDGDAYEFAWYERRSRRIWVGRLNVDTDCLEGDYIA
jgi:hypothetical protein